MKKRNIIIIVIIIIVIAILGLYSTGFLKSNHTNDPTVYANSIKDVGTFNSTGVTNFTMDNSTTNNISTDYVANDNLTKLSVTNDTNLVNATTSGASRLNETVKAHAIYKDTLTDGQHKGETRYLSILTDNNKFVIISTPDYSLTAMMADTFKFA